MPTEEFTRPMRRENREITRRAALQYLAGAAGLAAGQRAARAADAPATQHAASARPAGRAARETIERLGDLANHDRTLPPVQHLLRGSWCSRDSRYFVYLRSNLGQWRRRLRIDGGRVGNLEAASPGHGGRTPRLRDHPDGSSTTSSESPTVSADLMKVDLDDGSPKAVYAWKTGKTCSPSVHTGPCPSITATGWPARRSKINSRCTASC